MGPTFIEVQIESLAPGGDAFGRQLGGAAEGRATFVAFAAPGERVRARIVREKRDVAFAELVEVLEPSARRVQPSCPLFGACGGCQWQHVDLEAQRAAKLAIVKRALRTEEVLLRTPSPAFGYRDRAKFAVVRRGTQTLIGFKRRQSHEVIDVPQCPLLSPAGARGLAVLRAHPPAEGEAWLQAAPDGTVELAQAGASRTAAAKTVNLAAPGEPALEVKVGGFAQVGALANRDLVDCVLDQVGPAPGSVLELYAGAGNFTRFLVQRSPRVLASDGEAASVELGKRNVPQAEWAFPQDIPLDTPFDTVVVDPPRAGLDPLGLDLTRLAGRTIVYVSCDPQTLGRDLRRLTEWGFRLAGAQALDLMPQTHHVEVVARLERVRG